MSRTIGTVYPAPTIGPQTYPANYTGATTQYTTTVFTGNDHLYDAYALWFTLITGFNVIVAPLWGLLADWMVKFLVTCGHTFQKAQMGMVCFMYVLVAAVAVERKERINPTPFKKCDQFLKLCWPRFGFGNMIIS